MLLKIAFAASAGRYSRAAHGPGIRHIKTPIIRQKTQSVTQKERQTRNLSEKRSGLTEKRGWKAKNHRVDINRARPAAKGRSFNLQIIFTVGTQYSTQTLATYTKSITKVLNNTLQSTSTHIYKKLLESTVYQPLRPLPPICKTMYLPLKTCTYFYTESTQEAAGISSRIHTKVKLLYSAFPSSKCAASFSAAVCRLPSRRWV